MLQEDWEEQAWNQTWEEFGISYRESKGGHDKEISKENPRRTDREISKFK